MIRQIIIITAAALMVGCADSWDDHYDAGQTADATLWQTICSRSDVSSFARLLADEGYDQSLDAPQRFTVWIPAGDVSLTLSTGEAMTDEEVLEQVVLNHIARGLFPIASTGVDTTTVLNGKRMAYSAGLFNGVAITERNIECSNGVLHILEQQAPFNHNIWTYLRQESDFTSLCEYLYSFNTYVFDADESVEGGVVGGQKYYSDSVFVLENELWSQIGYLNDEDETFTMIAPVNDVWQETVDTFKSFYRYSSAADSALSEGYAKRAIVGSIVFNESDEEDMAALSAIDVSGAETIACSNGTILKTTTDVLDPYAVVAQEIIVEAEQESKYETTKSNCSDDDDAVAVLAAAVSVSGGYYMPFTPSSTILKPTVTYALPNVLSATYDIGVVMVPLNLTQNGYSSSIAQKKARLSFQLIDRLSGENVKVDSVIYDGTSIDTLWVVKGHHFSYCDYYPETTSWDETAKVRLKITNDVKRSETSDYTRSMYIDCIVIKPRKE